MAGSNTNIQITDLDFDAIKNNLKNYLKSQDTLKDYNYEGSALSVLLDLLAYNTQYNAYYLNMVANEMFLDSALQRDSVVSLAKLLNYIPKSAVAPQATINLTVNQVTDASLTLPKNTPFLSEAIDGINYTFVTAEEKTVSVVNNTAQFQNIIIKQGTPAGISYTVDSTQNPTYTFKIPEINVDTSSLSVVVQQSSTNTYIETYTQSTDVLNLDSQSRVYFLQEGNGGYYEVYFGNGVLGNKLTDGNIVRLSYITTSGQSSYGANSFVVMSPIGGYSNTYVTPIVSSSSGSGKESISSIKFQAPKSYSAQNRAVTKEDYITAIQQNNLGFSFDAVNVWGGQENNPPVYGQVFVSLKPSGAYDLTNSQKQQIITNILQPISMMTVTPTIVDPDYTYIQITANVFYDPKRTSRTASELQTAVRNTISNLAKNSLNTFNSVFTESDFILSISNVDSSIITNVLSINVQKKFYPILTKATSYNLDFGTPLQKGMFLSGIYSSPACQFKDLQNLVTPIEGVYIEEVPSSAGGIQSITVLNPGYGYYHTPTVTILGDGTGATAEAVITTNGIIRSVNVTNPGTGYTSAIVTITPSPLDSNAALGSAIPILEGQYGTLRLYYNDTQNVKTVYNSAIGTVDYNAGIINLNSFGPTQVDNDLGQLTITAKPISTIISSTYNSIITVDPFDPAAIVVNVTAKT